MSEQIDKVVERLAKAAQAVVDDTETYQGHLPECDLVHAGSRGEYYLHSKYECSCSRKPISKLRKALADLEEQKK